MQRLITLVLLAELATALFGRQSLASATPASDPMTTISQGDAPAQILAGDLRPELLYSSSWAALPLVRR